MGERCKFALGRGVVLATVLVGLVGCAGMNNQQQGGLMGSVMGGLIGSQIGHGSGRAAAIVGGVLLGQYLGSQVGADMDARDKAEFANTLESGPSGVPHQWQAADRHASYTVTPTRDYREQGRVCRKFRTLVDIDGRRQTAVGRACRDDQGRWHIQG